MSNKIKAALQGRQCQNSNQIRSQLITQIDHVKRCSDLSNGNSSSVKRAERNFTLCHGNNKLISAKPQALLPVLLYFAGGCFGYISGDSTSPKFLGGVFPVVCDADILTAPLAQFVKASRSLNQRRDSALSDIENHHLQNILHLLTQIFGSVGNITHSKPVQPFSSMLRDFSSLRITRLSQAEIDSSPSTSIACFMAFSSAGSTLKAICLFPRGNFVFDMCLTQWLSCLCLTMYNTFQAVVKQRSPEVLPTRSGLLTTNAKATSEAAMNNHITPLNGRNSLTLNKFTWRFLALNRHDIKAKPCRLSVEATTEHEARRILAPHFILSFAARLPVQEVRHV
ncbi:host cell division inhibitor Icd-like protein [Hafnia paralvei]|uniref:host cell division inhibitor Icd-like protein n=1 Tax=Hafnia paralvei TaxID=546367 RepID=UPI003F5CDC19